MKKLAACLGSGTQTVGTMSYLDYRWKIGPYVPRYFSPPFSQAAQRVKSTWPLSAMFPSLPSCHLLPYHSSPSLQPSSQSRKAIDTSRSDSPLPYPSVHWTAKVSSSSSKSLLVKRVSTQVRFITSRSIYTPGRKCSHSALCSSGLRV